MMPSVLILISMFERITMWDLEGLKVEGKYMGDIAVAGRVESSRVKYGGEVVHTVVLDAPINVYGAERDRVLLENKYVERVYAN